MQGKTTRSGNGSRRGGFSFVELLLVVSVLMVTLLLLSRSLGSSVSLKEANRESALAVDGAREMIELLQGEEEFSRVFARYNDDASDDPDGPGTAPGSGFAVAGLQPLADDPDGRVGEIRFPSVTGFGAEKLREDLVDEGLGMPRDLNGDGDAEDELDDDYRLLPVSLTLRWTGRSGTRALEVQTLLADR